MGGINSIKIRQERYYKMFIEQKKSKQQGAGGIENTIANKENMIRKSIMNPGKVQLKLKCDDKLKKSKMKRIMLNNINIANRI